MGETSRAYQTARRLLSGSHKMSRLVGPIRCFSWENLNFGNSGIRSFSSTGDLMRFYLDQPGSRVTLHLQKLVRLLIHMIALQILLAWISTKGSSWWDYFRFDCRIDLILFASQSRVQTEEGRTPGVSHHPSPEVAKAHPGRERMLRGFCKSDLPLHLQHFTFDLRGEKKKDMI